MMMKKPSIESRKVLLPTVVTAIGSLIIVTAYVAVNWFIFPGLALTISHLLTVILTTVIATTAAYLIARKADAVNIVLEEEIAERERSETELVYLAVHDPLTGVLNRRSMVKELSRAIARAQRGRSSVLLFIDVDGFKAINDRYGHATGDELLRDLTALLTRSIRTEDLLARLGGDELIALVDGAGMANGQSVAERIRRMVEDGFSIPEEPSGVTVSIGLAAVDGHEGADAVLSRADRALYAAKRQGRNRVEVARPVDGRDIDS